MKLQGTYSFDAPLETVWRGLFDPEVLASTLPGCDQLERQGDQFLGEINVKMGPVQGKFQGKVDIQNVKDRESYTMVVDGRGPAGFAKATAHIRLESEGASTRLHYDSDVQVGGRIASVGQRLLDASSRAIVKQSLEGLHEQLKALAARGVASSAVSSAASSALPPAAAAVDAAAAPAPVAPAVAAPAAAPAALIAPELVVPAIGSAHSPAAGPLVSASTAVAAHSPAAAPVAAAEAVVAAAAPVAVRTATARPHTRRAPSQAAFALGVAKEVTKELLPGKLIWALLAALLGAWLVYRLTRFG